MSQKNLLEMDNLNQSSPKARPDLPKPKPRRMQRQSDYASPLASPSKPDRGMDDVMSITPPRGSPKTTSKIPRRDVPYLPLSPSSKQSYPKSSKSAFDNAAFVHDEEMNEIPEKNNDNDKPIPVKRNSLVSEVTSPIFPNSSGKNMKSWIPGSPKRLSSWDANSEENSNAIEDDVKDDDEIPSLPHEKESDGSHSDATFTIENEKYQESPRLSRKPPKSNSSPKASKIPKPSQRKSVSLKETVLQDLPNRGSAPATPKKKIPSPSSKTSRESLSPEKKQQDYLAVQLENDDDISVNDGNTDKTVDESESPSVSSSVAPKETKKSRFGKLFGSSFSTESKKEKAKNKNSSEKDASPEAPDKGEGTTSFVHRWKKTAHTFLRTPSKPIDEEAPPLSEESKDESKSEKASSPSSSSKHRATKSKSKDTKIFMPESDENSSEESASATSDVKGKYQDARRKARDKPEEDVAKETVEEKSEPKKESSYKRFTKILRSRSREKDIDEEKPPSKDEKDEKEIPKEESPAIPLRKSASATFIRQKSSELIKPEKKLEKSASRTRIETTPPMEGVNLSASSDDDEDIDEQEKENMKSESDSESMHDTPLVKSKSSRKRAKKPIETLELADKASGKELLFGVTIHSSDLLPIDPNVIHPVVKVTVMFQTGEYMKRNPPDESGSPENKRSDGKSEKRSKKRRRSKLEATEAESDSILPIMSQPCQARHSIPTFAPTWNELVVFEEPFRRFVTQHESSESQRNPIIFFEIMDFLPMNSNGNPISVSGFHGSESGWYKVAWAFLKPIGANDVMNVNRKLRLQLFKPIKIRAKDKLPGPEVFSWWKVGRREKVNATLYVTPKGIQPPETRTASLRQLLSMRKEQLTQAILDSQLATHKKRNKSRRPSLHELREQANWSRMEGQSCKPPNRLVASLPASQIESLNIVICGNVHCVKFSPCGFKLAAGLDTDELHVILIFEVPSWTLLKTLKGHHGIIYDLTWKVFELDDHTSYHYLASASADSTVRIWKMNNHNEKTLVLFKILYHPSYVYTVKFHPTHPSLLATGCFDGLLRIWDMKPEHAQDLSEKKKKKDKKEVKNKEMSPIILLDKHHSFVNCLLFDTNGQFLYSGDGSASLFKWSCHSPSHKKSWRLERDAKLHHGNIPINSIDLHPSSNRILVHLRDNFIKILDSASFIPLLTFSGLQNERYQIRSIFSPCGNLVLSGSEQCTLCIWDADTGKILQFLNPRNNSQCTITCVDYHPFDYYISAGLASTISEPSPVLIYHHYQPTKMNYPLLKKTAMKMSASLDKSRSQSTESVTDSGLPIATRGNSSEKFVSIIQKLDSALYLAQQRNKRRETEAQSSTCVTSSNQNDKEQSRLPVQKNEIQPAISANNDRMINAESSGDHERYAKIIEEKLREVSPDMKENRDRSEQEQPKEQSSSKPINYVEVEDHRHENERSRKKDDAKTDNLKNIEMLAKKRTDKSLKKAHTSF